MVLSGSHKFSMVLIGSRRFLNGSQCCLLVLIGSQWFFVFVICSQLFS